MDSVESIFFAVRSIMVLSPLNNTPMVITNLNFKKVINAMKYCAVSILNSFVSCISVIEKKNYSVMPRYKMVNKLSLLVLLIITSGSAWKPAWSVREAAAFFLVFVQMVSEKQDDRRYFTFTHYFEILG